MSQPSPPPASSASSSAPSSSGGGRLKDLSSPMADAYHPEQVEAGWDAWWEAQGLYRPRSDEEGDSSDPAHSPFVIVIPPPNVTGTLHLGHALTCSIEDAIVRWQRMRGRDVLWLPGVDHAGIATQVVVEKRLWKEQRRTRHDLGRDAFVQEVWKWKNANGDRIKQQIRRLGASVDWSREVFTMDARLSAAVTSAFILLHERGLIYRSNRLVNWSCALRTAISSIEVDHVELPGPTPLRVPGYDDKVEFGVLHSFAYQTDDGSGDELVVATTRLETMLGDTAVAVHPADPRYSHLHGRTLRHPFIPERTVRVVTDDKLVDMSFGTGAVKVTPAHDPNDFECGLRHGLPSINIFTDDGLINANGGQFAGQRRFDCRAALITALTERGLYRGKSGNAMSLGICSRSKDVVEPVLRPQWWVDCASMAARAVDKVRTEELRIVPAAFDKVWFQWLENIQDWCISRQLWWGHRIPAYHVSVPSDPGFAAQAGDDNSCWVVGKSSSEALLAAHARWPAVPSSAFVLRQDEDVLDTWFSSGLFPFSTMGWPDSGAADMRRFYPNTLLETGHDILFFWVARMVMMGLELTGSLPFTSVFLHAMVRDKFGRKMCWGRGTRLLRIDGGDVAVEDVQEGDQLMGDDSTPRVVLPGSLTTGRAVMYEVRMLSGGREAWTCNDSHVLVLRLSSRPRPQRDSNGRFQVREFVTRPGRDANSHVPAFATVGLPCATEEEAHAAAEAYSAKGWAGPLVFECTVRDFLSVPKRHRAACSMMQPDIVHFPPLPAGRSLSSRIAAIAGAELQQSEVELTAWLLGVWLTHGEPGVAVIAQASEDRIAGRHHSPEIAALLRWHRAVYADRCGGAVDGSAGVVVRTGASAAGNELFRVRLGERLHSLLESYGLLDLSSGDDGKRIPLDLLTETETVRLALLAGVMDGSGELLVKERCQRVSARHCSFMPGLQHLARGLGLRTGSIARTACEDEADNSFIGWKLSISGGIHRVAPWQQLEGGKCPPPPSPTSLSTDESFSLRQLPGAEREYFGFELSGNGRCLLSDFVISHNSKSLGNVVDPLDVMDGITLEELHRSLQSGNLEASEVQKATEGQKKDFPNGIERCGADALRFGLLAYSAQGRDINLDIQRVVAYRQFGNKLWQATRFALLNFDSAFVKPDSLDAVAALVDAADSLSDRFVLSRLHAAVLRANRGFESYQFAEATTAVYSFWLYDLCDLYLELIKPRVKAATDSSSSSPAAERASALAVLYCCLRTGLLLLHPLMPFISEELYHRLPQAMQTAEERSGTGGRRQCGSIMVQDYPSVAAFARFDRPEVEALHSTLQDIAKAARSTRSTLGLTKKRVDLFLLCSDAAVVASLSPHRRDIATLAVANAVTVLSQERKAEIPAGCTSAVVSPSVQLFIPLRGLVDFGAEIVKMEKQQAALQEGLAQLQAKVSAAGYEKTKPEVQQRNADKLRDDAGEAAKLSASIAAFKALMSADELRDYQQQKIAIRQQDADRAKLAMDKILPAGGDEAKLSKKIASKYAELKQEQQRLVQEIDALKREAAAAAGGEQQPQPQ